MLPRGFLPKPPRCRKACKAGGPERRSVGSSGNLGRPSEARVASGGFGHFSGPSDAPAGCRTSLPEGQQFISAGCRVSCPVKLCALHRTCHPKNLCLLDHDHGRPSSSPSNVFSTVRLRNKTVRSAFAKVL